MDGLVEKRWKRYGKDRVYLSTSEGLAVGHIDLVSKTLVVTEDDHCAAASDCFRRWCTEGATEAAPTEERDMATLAEVSVAHGAAHEPTPTIEVALDSPHDTVPNPPVDLVANLAGAAARAKREEVNAESPVRNFFARVLRVNTEERAWRVGAKGEEKVAGQLAKLGDGWHRIHAVPVGEHGSDIDHVVIGPPGVFTINAKRHPGGRAWVGERAVMVNGHKTDYLRNSRFEAHRANQLLTSACGFDVPVQAVIAFVDLDSFTVKQMPPAVHVTTRLRLRNWLTGLPPQLDAGKVERIFAAARLSTTWQP